MQQAGYSLAVGWGLLIVTAAYCCRAQLLDCRLGSWGSWAQFPPSSGIFPDQGLNPVSSALAGRFLTIEPPGKSKFMGLVNVNMAHLGNLGDHKLCLFSLPEGGTK